MKQMKIFLIPLLAITLIQQHFFAIVRCQDFQDYQDYPAQVDSVNYDSNVVAAIITSSYNQRVRAYGLQQLKLKMNLKQVVSIDEKNQLLTATFYLACQWQDNRLTWDTTNSSFGSLTEVVGKKYMIFKLNIICQIKMQPIKCTLSLSASLIDLDT